MITGKRKKTRGKLKLSQYFQELKEGDKVAIVREPAAEPKFPTRIQGKSGTVTGKKGNSYVLRVMDGNEAKTYVIKPIHLKKLK